MPQDFVESVKWYRLAAEQGYALAQASLGARYEHGDGVSRDDAEAAKWYRMAADQGHAEAQTNLGAMYHKGQGVPQDFAEALKWYRKAADQGWARAQALVGFMYLEGEGVPQDYVQAHVRLNLAAAALPPGDMRDMAVRLREVLADTMTPAQIAEAQRLAREWKPKKM